MMERCYNPRYIQYKDYGARGISVELFLQNPHNYISYMLETLPPKQIGQSMDRIDNDGDYVRGNLRWATQKTQNNNQRERIEARKYPTGVSGFRGVSIFKPTGTWRARFQDHTIGYYQTPEFAAHVYDDAAFNKFGEAAILNFGRDTSDH